MDFGLIKNWPQNKNLPTGLSRLRELNKRADKNTLNLGIGVPFEDTPVEIKPHLQKWLSHLALDYSPNQGDTNLLEQIAKKYQLDSQNICITIGAQEGLMATLLSLLNPSDEVLIPNPGFLAYATMVKMLGGKPVDYNLEIDANRFTYSTKEILAKVTDKTKAMIITDPSNPTGTLFNKYDLSTLAQKLEEKGIVIISDEVYGELNFTEKYQPNCHLAENIITINSLSKSHAMTGWRIGWTLSTSQQLIQNITIAHQYIATCATRAAQNIAYHLLSDQELFDSILERYIEYYKKNAEMAVELFNQFLPTPLPPTQASFYLFVPTPNNVDDVSFCNQALNEKNVLVVPGSFFGKNGKAYYRVSVAGDSEKLKKAIKLLKDYY